MPVNHQDRVYRQVNSPLADTLQRRSWRRLVVLSSILGALLVAAGIYTGGDRLLWVSLWSIPFWASMYFLNLSLRGIFELSDERLDEHQIGVRNKAYKTAFGYTLVFLITIVIAADVLTLGRVGTFSIAAFAFLTCIMAPRLITAWTLEDSDDGE